MSESRRTREPDRGFTLVELLVYVVLLGVILAAGFALLTNSFRGSNLVLGSADASREGQTVARTITSAVRNATHVSVNAAGTVVTARIASGACVAWRFRDGGIQTHFPYGGTGSAAVAVPTNGWTPLATGVRATAASTPVFAPAQGGVSVRFTLDTATSPTLIETLVVPRFPATGSSRCLV